MKRVPLFVLLMVILPALGGCFSSPTLQIEPFRKATAIAPKFSQSYYYLDRDRNLYFVMRADTTDTATHKPVTQIVTIRMFWHPNGGVTTLHPEALNATFRYLVMTPDALGMYEGAGFVRPRSDDGVANFELRVVDADLRLTQASAGFNDTLGRARVHGTFRARYDDARAVEMLLEAHREFFARSLVSKPATRPATAEDWGITGTQPAATQPASTQPTTTQPGTLDVNIPQ